MYGRIKAPEPKMRSYIDPVADEALQTKLFGRQVRIADQSVSKITNPIAAQTLMSANIVAEAIGTQGNQLKAAAQNIAGLIANGSAISGDILSAAEKAHVKQDLLYLGTRVIPKLEGGDFQFSNTEKEHLLKLKDSLPPWTNPASAGLADVLDYKEFDENSSSIFDTTRDHQYAR